MPSQAAEMVHRSKRQHWTLPPALGCERSSTEVPLVVVVVVALPRRDETPLTRGQG